MGEQMTREQIEAWLALEGWTPYKKENYIPMYKRENRVCYITRFGECNIKDSGLWDDELDDPAGASFTDEQLQLIYQEIIKHEKD